MGKCHSQSHLTVYKNIADMIHSELTAQSMREMLLKKKQFPKSIVIDAEFLRNMRLYVDRHKIQPNMPLSQLRKALTLSDDEMGSVDYEEVVLAAIMDMSSATDAARDAKKANLDDLVPFLKFIGQKHKKFAYKVLYLPGTNKISAVFFMTGYQRAKLLNFCDVLVFDAKIKWCFNF